MDKRFGNKGKIQIERGEKSEEYMRKSIPAFNISLIHYSKSY